VLPETVSTDELARLLGISDRQVRELARDGTIIRKSRGLFDLNASVARYAARLRDAASGRGGETVQTTLATQRARLAQEKADAEAMKNAKSRGDLIDAKEVERAWAEILRDVRSRMLAVPNRLQQRLAHLTANDTHEIDVEIREALEALAND
jgi:terminase small subunit / prophage DNA-packing protein